MRVRMLALACCALVIALLSFAAPARAQKKDYLSDSEAEKIRNAEMPSDRIKLFISFAADRIKKLQFELARPSNTLHRSDQLNALINGYTGCIDDAADLIDLGVDKQQDVRVGIKNMQAMAPDFLTYLKGLQANSSAADDYKDNLDDAVEATMDAISTAADAAKENAPPPVRRNPSQSPAQPARRNPPQNQPPPAPAPPKP